MSTKVKVAMPDSNLKIYTCTFSLTTTVKARNEEEAKYLAMRELVENTGMYEFTEEQIIEETGD